MSYDRETDRIVVEDPRVRIAGLGDEGGSGSWLACAMKLLGRPDKAEIDRYQQFIDGVLWGRLQYADGPRAIGVRKSLFYYEPSELPPDYYDSTVDWSTWTSWNRDATEAVHRSFNYPHVAAVYWAFYRLARNHVGLVTNRPWEWYLTHAYETSLAMVRLAPRYAGFGQMEGSVFLEILHDLEREGWREQAEPTASCAWVWRRPRASPRRRCSISSSPRPSRASVSSRPPRSSPPCAVRMKSPWEREPPG